MRKEPEPPYLPQGPLIPMTSAWPWMKLDVSRVNMILEWAPLGVQKAGSPVAVLGEVIAERFLNSQVG